MSQKVIRTEADWIVQSGTFSLNQYIILLSKSMYQVDGIFVFDIFKISCKEGKPFYKTHRSKFRKEYL